MESKGEQGTHYKIDRLQISMFMYFVWTAIYILMAIGFVKCDIKDAVTEIKSACAEKAVTK